MRPKLDAKSELGISIGCDINSQYELGIGSRNVAFMARDVIIDETHFLSEMGCL